MEAQVIEEQELLEYECTDGSQVIIATTEEVISAADGCDLSDYAEGQVLEVLHEPESGNYIVQANFTTANGDQLHNGIVQLRTSAAPGKSSPAEEEGETDSDPNQCRHCGVAFESANALKLHLTVHVDEAYYACEFCKASKIHWTEMWLHQCSNVNSAPLTCPHCFKKVSSKKQLQVHEEVHELQRRFASKRMEGYFKRKLQETEEPEVDWGAKPFICGVCGKPFAKLYEVEYHEKLHNGERPSANVCDKCGIFYLNRNDLNKHTALGCTGQLSRKTDACKRQKRSKFDNLGSPPTIQIQVPSLNLL